MYSDSIAFYIIFWNMGILRAVEIIRKAGHELDLETQAELLESANTYEKDAVHHFGLIAKRINEASILGDFQLAESSETRLPLISHHANTSLVVFALIKGIEHTISSNLPAGSSTISYSDPTNFSLLSADSMESLRFLLRCLSTLNGTVSGQFLARPALHDLVHKHSDILLDCWGPDIIDT